jgi:hypothetical protein
MKNYDCKTNEDVTKFININFDENNWLLKIIAQELLPIMQMDGY